MRVNSIGGVSLRKWGLLMLPVTVGFVVGGSAPTLFDNPFNYGSAILWALIILIIDYNIMRVKKLNWFVATCRIAIILCSAIITATVGELKIFDSDVQANRVEQYDKLYTEYTQSRSKVDLEIKEYSDIRDCQDPKQPLCPGVTKGYGTVYHNAVKQIKALEESKSLIKPPSIAGFDGNILQKIKVIHNLITENILVLIMYLIFTLLVILIEALPIILKNAKVN